MRLVKFQKKIRDTTSCKNPTSLIKKTACTCGRSISGLTGSAWFLPAAKPRRSMGHVWPSSSPYNILEIVAIRGQKSMVTYVIEVTELNFEVRSDLRGRLEAAMASEAVEGSWRQYAH